MSLNRRHLPSGAAATAAVRTLHAAAAIDAMETSIALSVAPLVDRQTFFGGKLDWIFSACRREEAGSRVKGVKSFNAE